MTILVYIITVIVSVILGLILGMIAHLIYNPFPLLNGIPVGLGAGMVTGFYIVFLFNDDYNELINP